MSTLDYLTSEVDPILNHLLQQLVVERPHGEQRIRQAISRLALNEQRGATEGMGSSKELGDAAGPKGAKTAGAKTSGRMRGSNFAGIKLAIGERVAAFEVFLETCKTDDSMRLQEIGFALEIQGHTGVARKFYQRVLAAMGPLHPKMLDVKLSLGASLVRGLRPEEGLRYMEIIEEEIQHSSNHNDVEKQSMLGFMSMCRISGFLRCGRFQAAFELPLFRNWRLNKDIDPDPQAASLLPVLFTDLVNNMGAKAAVLQGMIDPAEHLSHLEKWENLLQKMLGKVPQHQVFNPLLPNFNNHLYMVRLGLGWVNSNRAQVWSMKGDFEKAIHYSDLSIKCAREIEDICMQSWAYYGRGIFMMDAASKDDKKMSAAIKELEMARDMFELMPEINGRALATMHIGVAQFRQGHTESAREAFADSTNFTAAMAAAMGNYVEGLEVAIAVNTDLLRTDYAGYNCFDYAVFANNAEAQAVLLGCSAGPELKRDADVKRALREAIADLRTPRCGRNILFDCVVDRIYCP
jgi:tetratricopeptide (TPR) repeat protein